jgi:hypothetical protein
MQLKLIPPRGFTLQVPIHIAVEVEEEASAIEVQATATHVFHHPTKEIQGEAAVLRPLGEGMSHQRRSRSTVLFNSAEQVQMHQ